MVSVDGDMRGGDAQEQERHCNAPSRAVFEVVLFQRRRVLNAFFLFIF